MVAQRLRILIKSPLERERSHLVLFKTNQTKVKTNNLTESPSVLKHSTRDEYTPSQFLFAFSWEKSWEELHNKTKNAFKSYLDGKWINLIRLKIQAVLKKQKFNNWITESVLQLHLQSLL